MDKYKRDIKETWECREDNARFKNKVVQLYRTYVQEEKSGEANPEAEDPQVIYNRDREQMERSLDALRRALKTDSVASKREVGKMMRESVLLTNELNILRKDARGLQMQRKAIDQAGGVGAKTNIPALMDQLGLVYKKPKPKEPKQQKAMVQILLLLHLFLIQDKDVLWHCMLQMLMADKQLHLNLEVKLITGKLGERSKCNTIKCNILKNNYKLSV